MNIHVICCTAYVAYWHFASVRCDAQIRVAIEGIADIGEALLSVGVTRMTRSGGERGRKSRSGAISCRVRCAIVIRSRLTASAAGLHGTEPASREKKDGP